MMIADCMAYMKLQAVVSSVLNQMHGQMMARERQVFLPRYNPFAFVSMNAEGPKRRPEGGEWEPIKNSYDRKLGQRSQVRTQPSSPR